MKKVLSLLICIMMVSVVAFSFAACGAKTGKYKFYGVKVDNTEIKLKDMTDAQKLLYNTSSREGDYIKLSGNNNFVDYNVSVNTSSDKYKTEVLRYGVYEIYDEKLVLDFAPKDQNESDEYVIRDGKIYVPSDHPNCYYVFKK